jgi:hypothetical protein
MRWGVAAFAIAAPLLVIALPLDLTPSPDEEALFERLDPHMTVAGLRLEEATLDAAMRRFVQVDRRDWLKGTAAPYVCYVGPDGTRLGLGFGTNAGLLILRRFELAAPGTALEYVPNAAVAEANRPRCVPVMKLAAEASGRLRLGMTKAEAISLLGPGSDGSGGDSWTYSGSMKRELSPAQREILRDAGVSPEDFLVERELRLEFRNGRVVAIRGRQATRG